MQHQKSYKKILLIFGGLAVFVIGAVLGSFLILGSGTSDGKSFFLKNTASLGVGETENTVSAEEAGGSTNYTENLFAALNSGATRIGTSTVFNGVEAAAYLEEEISALFPVVSNTDIKISENASAVRYVEVMSENYSLASFFFQKVLEGSLALPEINPVLRDELVKTARIFSEIHTDMQSLLVPPQYATFHRQSLEWTGATVNLIEEGLLTGDSDPLRMLIALGGLEDVQIVALKGAAEIIRITEEVGL